jgi:hypothetical protein
MQQRNEICVVAQVAELILDVAVVHVDGYRSDLQTGDHAFDVFHPVVHVHTDVVALGHAATLQIVGEAVGSLFDAFVRKAPVTTDQGFAIADGVGNAFEEVGQVELHA